MTLKPWLESLHPNGTYMQWLRDRNLFDEALKKGLVWVTEGLPENIKIYLTKAGEEACEIVWGISPACEDLLHRVRETLQGGDHTQLVYNQNRDVTMVNGNLVGGPITTEPILVVRWETGGAQGGSCWGTEAEPYTTNAAPLELSSLYYLVEKWFPKMEYLMVRRLENLIRREWFTRREYYGNYVDYEANSVTLDALAFFFAENGLVVPPK